MTTPRKFRELRARLAALDGEPNPELYGAQVANILSTLPNSITPLESPFDDPLEQYNCYMFALQLVDRLEAAPFPPIAACNSEFVLSLIEHGYMEQVRRAARGELIAYFDDDALCHLGRVVRGGRVISKWGRGRLYAHGRWEISQSFGEKLVFYKNLLSVEETIQRLQHFHA